MSRNFELPVLMSFDNTMSRTVWRSTQDISEQFLNGTPARKLASN